ncbi:MAG: ABC transporter permease [Clostridiaceae bacterium]
MEINKRGKANKGELIGKASAVFIALLIWQIGAEALNQELLLVTPLKVLLRLKELVLTGDFWSSVSYSFIRILSGFLIALLSGVLLAAISGGHKLIETLLWPYVAVIKSTPVASFIILCLIWLDSSSLSVFISFLMVLPVVYTNILQGIKSTDKELLEMAAVFKMKLFKKLKYIYLPQVKPYLLSACTLSLGLCWKAGIAAEVIGMPDGSIGERLYEAKIYLSSQDLFAWTVVIIVISILFEKLFLWGLRKAYLYLERG